MMNLLLILLLISQGIAGHGSSLYFDGNGYVDMGDALAARNHWAFGIPLISEWAADVNCDGDIDFADAIAIRNHWGYIIPLDGCC